MSSRHLGGGDFARHTPRGCTCCYYSRQLCIKTLRELYVLQKALSLIRFFGGADCGPYGSQPPPRRAPSSRMIPRRQGEGSASVSGVSFSFLSFFSLLFCLFVAVVCHLTASNPLRLTTRIYQAEGGKTKRLQASLAHKGGLISFHFVTIPTNAHTKRARANS